MRASELLGLPVVDPDLHQLGLVLDVRLVQDGPLLGAFAALRVQGLVVGRHRVASRLGYDRYDQPGPWLVRQALQPLIRHNTFLPWDELVLEPGRVVAPASSLRQLAPL